MVKPPLEVLALLALMCVGCETQVNVVELHFRRPYPAGFFCRENSEDSSLLIQRVRDAASFSLVTDFIRVGVEGARRPSCRPLALIDWCDTNECTILERSCISISRRPGEPIPDPAEATRAFEEQLGDQLISPSAPSGWVAVRVVGTTQPCEELMSPDAAFDIDQLFACVNSCPEVLQTVTELELDLDVLGPCFAVHVSTCAGF